MKRLIAILALVLLSVPAVSLAQPCPLLDMADDLKLTDQQMEQIRSSQTAHRLEMIQLKADKEKAQLELRELMRAAKIDRKAVLGKNDQLSTIKANMASKRLTAKLDQLNFLNDEQRAEVRKAMMFKHRDGRRGDFRRGPRHGGFFDECPGAGMQMRGDRPMRGDFDVRIEKEIGDDDE